MKLEKSDAFIADVERVFENYLWEAGLTIAKRYLAAVESSSNLIAQYPELGPISRLKHRRLKDWRFFVLAGAFNKHLVFYEIAGDAVIMRRAMHGSRNLKTRLLE
jgi:plasmid stabilization system protein ParE